MSLVFIALFYLSSFERQELLHRFFVYLDLCKVQDTVNFFEWFDYLFDRSAYVL